MFSVRLDLAGIVFDISSKYAGLHILQGAYFKPFLSRALPDFKVFLHIDDTWMERESSFAPRVVTREDGTVSFQSQSFDADLDIAGSRATISGNHNLGLYNVLRSLSSILLIKRRGFLLHAGAVVNNGSAYVFFGPSGSGKTTIARLSGDRVVLSDETVAIAGDSGSYRAYATPFAGEFGVVKENGRAAVRAAFLIKKGDNFTHTALGGRDAVLQLLCSTYRPSEDPWVSDRLLSAFSLFIKDVPCYELYVRPEPLIWDYIDEHFG